MVNFEYKVVEIVTFKKSGSLGSCQTESSVLEDLINEYAEDGWEYLNSIVSPHIEYRGYEYFPKANLVFRRAKS